MKLKQGLLTHNSGDQQILMGVGAADFHGFLRSNATAAFIVDCLKSETTEAQIVERMLAEYDATREQIEAGVSTVLAKLREIGALDE